MIKKNIAVVRGVQKTKYDDWLQEFVKPGDSLFFTEEELSKQTASNAAKRLTLLDSKKGGRKFHSYFDVIEQMVVIRVRPAGEVPNPSEEEEEPKEEKEEQKVLSFAERMAAMEAEEEEANEEQPIEQVNVDFD